MIAPREYWKILSVIPVMLLFNLQSIFSEEMMGVSSTTLLCGKILSSTTHAGVTTFVLTIGNLYFLFLFNLLYGTYIFNDANRCGTYVFSRLRNRRVWFYAKVKAMLVFSFCYVFVVVFFLAAVSTWQSRKWPEGNMMAVALLMLYFFTVFSALTSTAISLLAFRLGSITAFLVVYFLEALMVFSLLIPSETMVAKIWSWLNPFGGIFSLEHLDSKVLFQIFYDAGLFILLICRGGAYIARMEVGLKDVETE